MDKWALRVDTSREHWTFLRSTRDTFTDPTPTFPPPPLPPIEINPEGVGIGVGSGLWDRHKMFISNLYLVHSVEGVDQA